MKSKFVECILLLSQTVLAHSYLKSFCDRILKWCSFISEIQVRSYLKDLVGRLSLDEIKLAHEQGVFDNVLLLKVVVEVITKYKHRGDNRVAAILRDYEGKYF